MSSVGGSLLERLLTLRRVRDYSIVTFAVNALIYGVVIARGRFPFDGNGMVLLPDLVAHVTGGTLALRGAISHLYDIDAQSAVQLAITHDQNFQDLFISPPLAALLFAPFGSCSYAAAACAWTIVSVALLLLSARVIRDLAPSISRAQRGVMLVALLASQPVIQLLGSGQDTGLSLLLWSCGVMLALRRRDAAAGLVMSLGLFKPQLFVLPPLVFLLLRRKRAIGAWTAGAVAQAALTWLIAGVSGLRGWWRILHSPQYLVFLRVQRGMRMTSLMPFVEAILPRAIGTPAVVIGAALSLATVVATLWRSRPGRARGAIDERGVWALACLATLLASPHLFSYDMTLLALPVALVLEIRGELVLTEKRALFAIYVLSWTAAVRAGYETAPWPMRALAASWTTIPVAYLWRAVPTRWPETSPALARRAEP